MSKANIARTLPILTAVLAFVVILAPTVGRASQSVTFDDFCWQSLSPAEQIVAVQGMLSGFDSGFYAGQSASVVSDALFVDFSLRHMSKAELYKAVEQDGKAPHFPNLGNATFNTTRDRITAVCRVNPDVMNAQIYRFVKCAATPSETCESALATYRKYHRP